jgi:hypothetical protein
MDVITNGYVGRVVLLPVNGYQLMAYTTYRRGYSRYVILHENGIFRVRFALSYVSGMHRFTEKYASNTYFFFSQHNILFQFQKIPYLRAFLINAKTINISWTA